MTNGPPGTIVFDLDGVLYLDRQGIPGAGDALAQLERAGWRLLFATNNSTKTPDDVATQIRERTGFSMDPASAVTSATSAAIHASARHATAFVVGSEALRRSLEREGVSVVEAEDAECVVVGLDLELSYESIDRAARSIRRGAGFIATNVDSTYPTPTGLAPGAGSIVAAISTASGVEPEVCGKPSPLFRSLVRSMLVGPRVWMVGDRPETDIAMAIAEGWTSVLVLTGVVSDGDDVPEHHRPTYVVPSVVDLPGLLDDAAESGDQPR